MQPLKQVRRRKLSQGISRARMLLRKNMDWLPGFPVEFQSAAVLWRNFPWNEANENAGTQLNGEHLRRMEFALTQLRHHFPQALPKLVPNVEGWLGRMDHLLAMLKEAIHHQRPLEQESWLAEEFVPRRWREQFERLHANHPTLKPLLRAVLFSQMTGMPQPTRRVLRWIEEQANPLHRLAIVPRAKHGEQALDLQLTFCTLRDEMPSRLQTTLMKCFSDEEFRQIPGVGPAEYARQLSELLESLINQKPAMFEIPERTQQTDLGNLFLNFLKTLLLMKPKVRRQILELWERLLPWDFLSQVKTLNRQVHSEETRLIKILKRRQAGQNLPANKREGKTLKKNARLKIAEAPQHFLESIFFALSRTESLSRSPSHLETWLEFFRCQEALGGSCGVKLFHRWEETVQQLGNGGKQAERRFHSIVGGLCELIRRHGPNEMLLDYWRQWSAAKDRSKREFLQEFLDKGYQREIVRRTLHLLEEIVFLRKISVGPKLLCSLVECAKATEDDARGIELIAALADETDQTHDDEEIRAALLLADDEEAISLLRALEAEYDLVEPATLLGRHLRDSRLRKVIRRMILANEQTALLRLTRFTQVLTGLGLEVPSLPNYETQSAWLAEYPNEFHEALQGLYSITQNAPQIAERVLAKDCPKPSRIRQEIAALQHLHAGENDKNRKTHLARRIENLARQAKSPRRLSPDRLENLNAKLHRRTEWELLESYTEGCLEVTLDYLKLTYQRDTLPKELFQSPYPELLAGILALKGETRELGLRLLFESFDEPAWSFLEQPSNLAFQSQMESRGIDLKPWTGSELEVAVKTKAGIPYRLRFTRRILDYLLMGFHFETCLAPDSFNFFSTIANAADLNKQVVYGKTDAGKIIGRCLFALTDQGTILTYRRYAHAETENFSAAVDQFAEQLARAMNATLASTGNVPNLAAKDWYDDGAIEMESLWNLQSEDCPVRVLLRSEAADAVLEKLQNLIGQRVELESLLDPLLAVQEFQDRPDLFPPFANRFGLRESVPFKTRFRLAVLSQKAGNRQSARRILDSLKPNEIVAQLKRSECCSCNMFHQIGNYEEVLDLLNAYNPSLALRVLRGTRSGDITRDEEERLIPRRTALAKIHQLLGRDHLARKLTQQV